MSEHDPEMDPEQEQRLRALLADLGSSGDGAEPLPDDVALRLDEALAGLVAERVDAPSRAPSHSRWRQRLAVAAVAVVVLGLGGGATVHLSRSAGENSTADSAAGGSAAQSQVESQPPDGSAARSPAQSPAQSPAPLAGKSQLSAALPRLSSAAFARGVTRLVGSRSYLRLPAAADTAAPACTGPSVTDGATVTPVSLDAAPAALVVHPGKGGKRLVEAWSCDGTRRLASTTIAP